AARRLDPAGPFEATAQAGLTIFGRINAVEPDLDPADHDAVAVDHPGAADDLGARPVKQPGEGRKPPEHDRAKEGNAPAPDQRSQHAAHPRKTSLLPRNASLTMPL